MNLVPLQTLINNLQTFDVKSEVTAIITDNKEEITRLQRDQLEHGIDIFGKPRIDEYRPLTKFIKKTTGVGLGAVTDRVTFFMTGKLYASLFTEIVGENYEAKSPLFTYDKMKDRIGDENFGLDYDSRMDFAINVLLPKFKVTLKDKTGLEL
jgi:hypothetical protein